MERWLIITVPLTATQCAVRLCMLGFDFEGFTGLAGGQARWARAPMRAALDSSTSTPAAITSSTRARRTSGSASLSARCAYAARRLSWDPRPQWYMRVSVAVRGAGGARGYMWISPPQPSRALAGCGILPRRRFSLRRAPPQHQTHTPPRQANHHATASSMVPARRGDARARQ